MINGFLEVCAMLTRILVIALVLTAVALVGCEKKAPTVGEQVDQAAKQAQPAAQDAAAQAQPAAADAQKAAEQAAADAKAAADKAAADAKKAAEDAAKNVQLPK
jgi:Sec-independent protein translocase protein TatA